jgi:hypothetical protein
MKKRYILTCLLSVLFITLIGAGLGPFAGNLFAASVGIDDGGASATEAAPAMPDEPGAPGAVEPSEEDPAGVSVKFLEADLPPEDVVLSLDVRMDDEQRLYIDIDTNLPDDTRIMLTITDTIGSVYREGRTLARVKAVVFDGTVTVGPFDVGDEPYPHGEYTIRVWTPALQLQPIPVQRAIGRRGGLTGPVVVDGRVYIEKTFAVIGMSKW